MLKTYRGRLDLFFPPDDPASPWLIRLAAIRDDLSFEIAGFEQAKSGQPDDLWRGLYFFRRMHVSLGEATSILNQEASKAIKSEANSYYALLKKAFAKWSTTLRESVPVVTPFRDAFGGHMRPSSADQERKRTDPTGLERDGLRRCGDTECTLVIDLETGAGTSLRPATFTVPLFHWTVEADEETAVRNALAVFPVIQESAIAVMHAIDTLLVGQWLLKGIFSEEDLARHGLAPSGK